jgi:hypothetical protein
VSTYEISKYVVSRKPFTCADCGREVSSNVQYLAYRPGLKRTTKVCQQCSTKRTSDGALKWRCRAVEEHEAHAARGFRSDEPIAARLAHPTSGDGK